MPLPIDGSVASGRLTIRPRSRRAGRQLIDNGIRRSKSQRSRSIFVEYLHTPLKEPCRQIRLLRLHPGRWHDDIYCDLQVYDMSSAPRYQAISYTWGAGTPLFCVLLNKARLLGSETKAWTTETIRYRGNLCRTIQERCSTVTPRNHVTNNATVYPRRYLV